MNSYNISLQQAADWMHGVIRGQVNPEQSIQTLLIDSRKVHHPHGNLFFAIKGKHHDGHRFLSALYDMGVYFFVVSQLPSHLEAYPKASFIVVPDVLRALQTLCVHHRKQFTIPVVGITGSNGKTIVKEWLYQLLRDDKKVVRSPKSFNSQVGVPLSVWQLNQEHDIALFEAGISEPGEMQALEQIIQPTLGIFTNIGQAHDENFESQVQKVDEKLTLFEHAQWLFYCKDHALIHQQISGSANLSKVQLFTWSKRTRANLQIGRITKTELDSEIQAVYNNDFIRIKIPFTDEASIENAIHCWALLLYLGYNNEDIAKRMMMLSPVAMRLELKEGINHCSIINDSYNSDMGSLAIALDFLNQQTQHQKHTLILSDILQSGKDETSLYQEVASLLKQKRVNRLIGIGPAISQQATSFDVQEKAFFADTDTFLNEVHLGSFRDETILLKGARAFRFEEISKVLQQKAHETVLEINLNALVHNLNHYKLKLKEETKVMAMVKAFSYGSGSFEIANVLQFHRVDYLAVAYADEGIELRKAGINLPIMVMNPEEQSFDAMIQYQLEPELFSFRVLNLFEDALKRNTLSFKEHTSQAPAQMPVHIKLDTGMRRLGFEQADLNQLAVRLRNNKLIKVQSVFSHLAASDEQEHDAFTLRQIEQFKQMSDSLTRHLSYPVLRHILNSAGIARFPDAQFDMVRLGIGLYGIGHNIAEQAQLQNVSTLKTTISQIKHVAAHETIGYSRKGLVNQATRIATLPIGYADGLSRQLSNGKGKMWVHGKEAPIIGNVCMDMCMIDITHIAAEEGDEVVVFGDQYPITAFAKDMNTIAYEALTSVSRRVKRVYYQE